MARFLFILLTSAIAMELFPISHPTVSMPKMHMDEMPMSYHSNMEHGSAGDNSTGTCCDEIASFAIGCAFLVPQYTFVDCSGDNERVIDSNPLVQSIYLETLTPPPKA